MSSLFNEMNQAVSQQQQAIEEMDAHANTADQRTADKEPQSGPHSPPLSPEDESEPSLLDEMQHGVDETIRPTERYSFEIYVDQKDQVRDLQYLYQKATGKRLPSSRIIREALDAYLKKALAYKLDP